MTDTKAVTVAVLGPSLFVVCAVMAAAAAIMYRLAGLGDWRTAPVAGGRAAAQLAAVRV